MTAWTDEEFLTYVELHSKTERHLFSVEHARRLCKLAGIEEPEVMPSFVAIGEGTAKALIELARSPREVFEPGVELTHKLRWRF